MTPRFIALAALVAGCAADEPTPSPGPAVDTPRCDRGKPFGAPARISELATPGDESGAHLTDDELTIFFASTQNTAGGRDLFRATRASVDEPFGNVERLDSLATAGDDGAPDPGDFGSYMLFERDGDILLSYANGSTFQEPGRIESVATPSDERTPYLTDGALYLSVDGELMSSGIIYGFLLSPEPLFDPGVGSGTAPVLDRDENTLLFARSAGSTATQIWGSTRDPMTGNFTEPAPVVELGDPAASMAPSSLSDDGCVLYLESNAGGDYDLYVARRPR